MLLEGAGRAGGDDWREAGSFPADNLPSFTLAETELKDEERARPRDAGRPNASATVAHGHMS